MADPGLRSYLYSQAERAMQELVSKGAISPSGHAEITKILNQEQAGGQQMGYPVPYQGQPQYNQYPNQPGYNAAVPYQAYQAPQVRFITWLWKKYQGPSISKRILVYSFASWWYLSVQISKAYLYVMCPKRFCWII